MPVASEVYQLIVQKRKTYQQIRRQGPTVVVIGGTDVGKSTLCRTLLNLSAKDYSPSLFVDLDMGQNELAPPGCFAFARLTKPISIESPDTSLPEPVVFSLGALTPSPHLLRTYTMLKNVARHVECARLQTLPHFAAGTVVNTMGWIDGAGFDIQVETIKAFRADLVICIECPKVEERLQAMLETLSTDITSRRSFFSPSPNPHTITLHSVPKPKNIYVRTRPVRISARWNRFNSYFTRYFPTSHLMTVPFNFATFHLLPTSSSFQSLQKVTNITQLASKVGHIGAFLLPRLPNTVYPCTPSTLDLADAMSLPTTRFSTTCSFDPVAGFCCLEGIDEEEQTVVFRTPVQFLPSRMLLLTSITWNEEAS
ncbi:putative Protein CLP1 like protein [Blattamonas nauphoetae]|uniref:Clp1 P-loop domain-containing protein n=1 Tax=Blattamonas nauphoetae TaxID=2049346 RepID=A0ABQ9X675_9EUKA|nr:putative Protein CLP1 like protein [Blattamonas nauphoetae]